MLSQPVDNQFDKKGRTGNYAISTWSQSSGTQQATTLRELTELWACPGFVER